MQIAKSKLLKVLDFRVYEKPMQHFNECYDKKLKKKNVNRFLRLSFKQKTEANAGISFINYILKL